MKSSHLIDVYYEHLSKEIEYWKPMEILDLLKRSLFKGNELLIELAKDILRYRNWVAHESTTDPRNKRMGAAAIPIECVSLGIMRLRENDSHSK